MKLRIAKKILKAIGTAREKAYTQHQYTTAMQKMERTKECRLDRACWNHLMQSKTPTFHAGLVSSWNPSKALEILMKHPESDWYKPYGEILENKDAGTSNQT